MATKSTAPIGAPSTPSYTGPFVIVTALFFIFGFITNLNMALVPHLRSIFSSPQAPLPFALAMLAESAFFLAYFVFSAPTSRLIESIGYKRTMVVSLFIQVIGCLLFVPAAKLVSFPLFLTAVFVVGAGVTALQTSANPYVAILGPEHSAPVRLTLAQALNSLGGSIAPIIAGHFILTDPALMATPAATANTVRGPYIAIAGGLLLLGIAVAFMHLPAISQTQAFRPAKEGEPILSRSIWSYKHTVLGAVGIFLYVGVEVGLASIAFNYFVSQGIHAEGVAHFFAGLGGLGALITHLFGPWNEVVIATLLVSLYWFGALIGRLLGSWLLTIFKSGLLLGVFGIAAAAMVLLSMVSSGSLAIWTLVLCGFFNSIMFPNIFALGIARLGPMTSKGSGLIMTAVVGGAVVPALIGWVADRAGISHSFVIPAFCYLFIAYYGLVGSKPTRTVTA
jgi:MFS transporter, FHS family, L-fucose permease